MQPQPGPQPLLMTLGFTHPDQNPPHCLIDHPDTKHRLWDLVANADELWETQTLEIHVGDVAFIGKDESSASIRRGFRTSKSCSNVLRSYKRFKSRE